MRRTLTALLCLILCPPLLAGAASTPDGLRAMAGKVTLPGGVATLDLPPQLRYLDPADARKVLVDSWGNPPGPPTLGMIVPAGVDLLGAAGWGVIIGYEQDGHVRDDDAGADYAGLLAQMKETVADRNTARREQGYAAMTLIGWAEPPRYDRARHQLSWAKELHTEGSNENGLSYNVRLLGREGALVLNGVAGMNQFEQVKRGIHQVAAAAAFTAGRRYADFDARTDRLAAYDLATLAAGGGAIKPGLLGKLAVALPGFSQLLLIAMAVCGVWLYKVLGRRPARPEAAQAQRRRAG
ncbi:DUF2167 domain-containing protein [Duganella sp. BJB488]|uniref:DUF2167 domain-containing protein n=1 Tax=unclassified Duganella TaxID=2636909 RepID=UPI000E353098|nr:MULTISPECIES: DUF2167 domain-containing protein [unclassified Duganella]RFP08817.1 DUF2167 domain-containing protein [Duganella sp. BJB489]RFP11563.1 DUF2167 domain-containing protein [Duganella sp. BJB488]RFP28546.1 DUF2167 domain-containing protein [Duganella sp. BJB480]